MNKYTIGHGDNLISISRHGDDTLQLEIGDKKVVVHTEDLAALVREELPKDRANELFSEIDEKEITSGYARVVVEAKNDIKKGDKVCFKINVNKYLGRSGGIRTTKSGIIY